MPSHHEEEIEYKEAVKDHGYDGGSKEIANEKKKERPFDLKKKTSMSPSEVSTSFTLSPAPTFDLPPYDSGSAALPAHPKHRLFTTRKVKWRRRSWVPVPHARRILLACSIVVIPMMVFTIIMIWAVFAHSLGRSDCPFPELCPGQDLVNSTLAAHYYIDFSAGRLAFISSLSSTISFALVSVLMMIYAYSTASQLLNSSEDHSRQKVLPSPYQTSMLIRVLNAEMLALYELAESKIKSMFWHSERSSDAKRKARAPGTLQSGILVLLLCIAASILIQLADTYLHITAEPTTFVEIHSSDSSIHDYSRSLAPWCYNRAGVGTTDNKNFWSCGVRWNETSEQNRMANSSLTNEYVVGSLQDYALNYTDTDGTQFAIIGPPNAPADVDWKASSFAVSTTCSAMPRNSCDIDEDWNFNCTKKQSGIDLRGELVGSLHQTHFFDMHRYLREPAPFYNQTLLGMDEVPHIAPNVTDEEANDVFSNPWHWLAIFSISKDRELMPETYKNSEKVWRAGYFGPLDQLWLLCNTTVWDATYTAVGHKVMSLEKTMSNGTMAGISSMTNLRSMGFFGARFMTTTLAASTAETPEEAIEIYSSGSSKIFTYSLAAQTTSQPAILAQTRTTKIVTQLPVAALWLLVLSNVCFALLAIVLAVVALLSASETVYQVHTRLSIAGLVAALFEDRHYERAVKDDTDLFEETSEKDRPLKKVGVKRTNTGGSVFSLIEVQDDRVVRTIHV
ncbi:hypothetical protein BDV96DRAFT_635562 [Lophiotrema nucula]|uniref:Uncharacterized protein n=1 Tax=Lophiotrema nucula TaxID=690887 RepID=A0A6A5YTQ4_9PLEO|nr:hypothetical protein BDV96DRAFT_635562 [Lophiotrema nucula]